MNNEFIAKIEGHGSLNIDWKKNQVELNIHEGERLFEGILVGRTAEEMHWITPRICGVCPTAHNLASLAALEDALGIKVNQTTILLRDLMQCGQMIQSHALHLFFLSLPDYLGIDRGTELAQKNPKAFKDALALKTVSDEIVKAVGGRIVHPTRTRIGGFHKIPLKIILKKLLEELKNSEKAAKETLELVSKIDSVCSNSLDVSASKPMSILSTTLRTSINFSHTDWSCASIFELIFTSITDTSSLVAQFSKSVSSASILESTTDTSTSKLISFSHTD